MKKLVKSLSNEIIRDLIKSMEKSSKTFNESFRDNQRVFNHFNVEDWDDLKDKILYQPNLSEKLSILFVVLDHCENDILDKISGDKELIQISKIMNDLISLNNLTNVIINIWMECDIDKNSPFNKQRRKFTKRVIKYFEKQIR